MLDFTKAKEGLKALLNEKTSKEDADKIASLSKELDDLEKQNQEDNQKYEDLKGDYIEMIKESGFKGKQSSITDDAPKSLEDCISEVIAKRTK